MSNYLTNIFSKKVINQKSLPSSSTMSVESYVNTAIPLSTDPKVLISYNKGYVYDCNKINSQTVASVPLKLYTISKSNGKKCIGDWVSAKSINKKEFDRIQSMTRNIRVKQAQEIVEITDHPFLNLMSSVSDTLDTFSLFELTESYLGLLGNAYWHIIKDKSGMPISIDVLPAEYMNCILDTQGHLTGYRLLIEGMQTTTLFKVDEIIHFRNVVAGAFRRINAYNSPVVGLYGMGHLESCLEDVELLNSIERFERALSQNNARPDFIVKYTNGPLEPEVQQKLYKQWNQLFKGNKNAGKVNVMDNQFEIVPLGWAPKDCQFLEGRKILRGNILAAFGVSEDFITRENSNRASSVTAIQQYYRFTIEPKLRRIQETINAALVSIYDENLFCQYDSCIPEDIDQQIKQDTSDINLGIRTVAEIRKERGYSELPDSEESNVNISN